MSVPQLRLCLASSNPGPDFQLPTPTPTPPSNLPKGLLLPPFQSDMARVSSKSSPTGLVARYTQFLENKKDPHFLFSIAMAMDYNYGKFFKKNWQNMGLFQMLGRCAFCPKMFQT